MIKLSTRKKYCEKSECFASKELDFIAKEVNTVR